MCSFFLIEVLLIEVENKELVAMDETHESEGVPSTRIPPMTRKWRTSKRKVPQDGESSPLICALHTKSSECTSEVLVMQEKDVTEFHGAQSLLGKRKVSYKVAVEQALEDLTVAIEQVDKILEGQRSQKDEAS